MKNSRRLTVGFVLFLSIFWSGSGRAQEAPPQEAPPQETAPVPDPAAEESEAAEEGEDVITVDAPAPLAGQRDPWAILQSTPGVLTDRINVGISCGCGVPEPVVPAGAEVGEGFPDADELLFDRAGAILSTIEFDPFQERPVETGETDLARPKPRAEMGLRRRGTNEWRAQSSLAGTGGALSAGESGEDPEGAVEANRVDSLRTGSAEVGGPLIWDRLWIWGEAGLEQIDRITLGGQEKERDGRRGRLKLNAQIGKSSSATAALGHGDSEGSGLGAAPGRAPETTWEEDGRETVWTAEGTAIHNKDFYSTLSLGTVDGRLDADPRSAGAVARIGADGVARGSWFDLEEERRTRQAQLRSVIFANAGGDHVIALGAGWRRENEDRALTPPGFLVVDGRLLGQDDGLAMLEIWRAGTAGARTETLGLWAQDTLRIGSWTALAGLRGDRQDLGLADGSQPWTLAPRLGLNWLASDGQTVVAASLGRFASRLGPRAAWHVDADAPALLRSLFEDRDGDLSPDPDEPLRPLPGEGIDPLRPGRDPDAVDARLRPETIDEVFLGVDHALMPDFLIGLQATWRRTRDLLEERLLVRNGTTGEVFTATAGDWVPAGRLTGALPDGTPYDVPFWDLRPGLGATGGTLLVNGDRRQEDLGLSLTWKKRLSNRWKTEGHLAWRDGDRELGSGFRRFDDPTNTLGGGDDPGTPVTRIDSGRPRDTPRFRAAGWSVHASGLVLLPREFILLAAVHGRRGDPLPYYRQVARERAGLTRVQLTGHADAVRTDDILTVDAGLEKYIRMSDVGFVLRLEAVNLLNEDTVLARELDLGTGRAASADETLASRTLRVVVKLFWR